MKHFYKITNAYLGLIQRKFNSIHGEIRTAEGKIVSGYAYSLKTPEPIQVKLFINDTFITKQTAEKESPGVTRINGSAACGFHFDLQNKLESGDKIEVKTGVFNQDLDNSPKRIPFLGSYAEVLKYFSDKIYDPPKAFFLHIPKTAGTTFRLIMRQHFHGCPTQPSRYVEIKNRGYPHFFYPMELPESEIEKCRYLSGHYSIIFKHLMGKNCQVLTFLRDPVARAISNLNHFKQNNHLFRDLQIEEIYDYVKVSMNNMQVRYLAPRHFEGNLSLLPNQSVCEHIFNDAEENLRLCFLVGICEYFDTSIALLEKKWNTRLGYKSHTRQNVTKQKAALSTELIEKIKTDNVYDIQLYNTARELFFSQCERYGVPQPE